MGGGNFPDLHAMEVGGLVLWQKGATLSVIGRRVGAVASATKVSRRKRVIEDSFTVASICSGPGAPTVRGTSRHRKGGEYEKKDWFHKIHLQVRVYNYSAPNNP